MTGVVTALSHRWDAAVAAALEPLPDIRIVRRCADLAELAAVAAAGLGECAVVSGDLRGLDLSVIDDLHRHGLWVVGVHPPGDEGAERRLRQLSVDVVVPVDASAATLASAIIERSAAPAPTGLEGVGRDATGLAASGAADADGGGRDSNSARRDADTRPDDDAPWQPVGRDALLGESASGPEQGWTEGLTRGRVLAVWGPAGAPGRTTIAVTVAAELASRGQPVLLIDADTYGGSVAQVLGLLDEAPGLAAACRAAEHGTFDLPGLARVAPEVTPGLRVLTGLPRADRWPEVRAAAFERVLAVSRSLAAHVIIDCGFCLEDDEELSYDTRAPRRNEATLTALASADDLLAVGGADPISLQRFVRGLQELGTVPSPAPRAVVNRVRASAVGGNPQDRIGASLERFAGLDQIHYVPADPENADAAVLAGRSIVEHAPESDLRRAVADLTTALFPATARRRDHRSRWRVIGRHPARARS
jgi:MinD-like ATPase involved in chromosome partitioning or flagellar assembly